MKRTFLSVGIKSRSAILLLIAVITCQVWGQTNVLSLKHGLHFSQIPTCWDEGIPLGNGIAGTLIWQKGDKLRLALDRADLWDLTRRPNTGSNKKPNGRSWLKTLPD